MVLEEDALTLQFFILSMSRKCLSCSITRVLLQVHDEVILEGPEENAQKARDRVVYLMGHPFLDKDQLTEHDKNTLRVDLVVDAKFADTWYEAK